MSYKKIVSNWKTDDMWAFLGRNLTIYMTLEKFQICLMNLSVQKNQIIIFLPMHRKFLSIGKRPLVKWSVHLE